MARAQTRTGLPLDEFARLIGLDPLHFNQLETSDHQAIRCDRAVLQNSWQGHVPAREDIAEAIFEAEHKLEDVLGYHLVPDWDEDAYVPVERPWLRPALHASEFAFDGFGLRVKLPRGEFQSGGIKATALLGAAAAVAWPGGGTETWEANRFATVTIAGVDADLDACEVRVYFQADDVVSDIVSNPDDRWEIRPVVASVSGTTLTLRIRRELLGLPSATEEINDPRVQDADLNANFVTAVDVYRVYNDPQTQATLEWLPTIDRSSNCSCTACTIAVQTACLTSFDRQLGIVTFKAADWNATTEEFDSKALSVCRAPERVRTFVRSGLAAAGVCAHTMDRETGQLVAMLAASLLPRDPCDCEVNERIRMWRMDLRKADDVISFSPTPDDLQNPLGPTIGAAHTWRRIRNRVKAEPVSMR